MDMEGSGIKGLNDGLFTERGTSFIYALSRAIMYVITSFGLVYLTEGLGYYGLWIVVIPVTVGYMWAVRYFEKIEKISSLGNPSALGAIGVSENLSFDFDKKFA